MIKNTYKIADLCSHNPYFNRWFSAIDFDLIHATSFACHNPYFNRWFSAIP